MIAKPKILVIIVTYNAMQWAERCLSSLKKSSILIDVFIIDNGSTDNTIDFIKNHYPEFTLVESDKNLGFGAANNLGLRFSLENKYDYVYLLNQDAWIYPDTFEKLLISAKSNPDYGIISPMQYCGNEKDFDSDFEMIYSSVGHNSESLMEVPFVMAAHWFIPCEALKTVGLFSPTFFHYGEDNNLVERFQYNNYKIGILTTSKAIHDRQDRPVPKSKRIYLKRISNLIRLSSPLRPFWKSAIMSFFFSIAFAVKECSLTPLLDYFKLLNDRSTIMENRIKSMNNGAFINNQSQS